jgi:hypothetical protein
LKIKKIKIKFIFNNKELANNFFFRKMSKFITFIALIAVLAIAVRSEIVAPKEPVLISARSNAGPVRGRVIKVARPQSNSNVVVNGGEREQEGTAKSDLSVFLYSCGSPNDTIYLNTTDSKDMKSTVASLIVNKRIPLDFQVSSYLCYNFYYILLSIDQLIKFVLSNNKVG